MLAAKPVGMEPNWCWLTGSTRRRRPARPVEGESQTSPSPSGSSTATDAARGSTAITTQRNLARLGEPHREQSATGSGPVEGCAASRETEPTPAGDAADEETATA